MTETMQGGRPFVVYEYKEVTVENRYAASCRDGYGHFGWQCEDNVILSGVSGVITLRLRRDRSIMNRAELTRLQRQFEACVNEIRILENSKTGAAMAAALSCGILGAIFLFVSVMAAMAAPPIIWLCVLTAITALFGLGMALPLHNYALKKRTERVEPLIEAKHDEIYAIFEKGHRLLNG